MYACRFLQASYDFALYGIPVTVSGNVGAGGRIRLLYTVKPEKTYVGAWGGFNVWGNIGGNIRVWLIPIEKQFGGEIMNIRLRSSAGMGQRDSYKHGAVYLDQRRICGFFACALPLHHPDARVDYSWCAVPMTYTLIKMP